MSTTTEQNTKIALTQYSKGAGCGCKIAPAILSEILAQHSVGISTPKLLVGNDTKDDAAVYQIDEQNALISTTDFFLPIVDDPFQFGQIAAANAISDVYANNSAKAGDILLLTKPLGVGILATAQKKQLIEPADLDLLVKQLTTLNKVGAQLGKVKGVHAMTDVTGFGILGHLIEMMEGSGLGATIHYNQLPILDAAKKYLAQKAIPDATYRNWNAYNQQVAFGAGVNVMEAFQILPDPQTNGGLLIAVSPASLEEVQSILKEAGIDNTDPIGVCTELEAKRIQVNV